MDLTRLPRGLQVEPARDSFPNWMLTGLRARERSGLRRGPTVRRFPTPRGQCSWRRSFSLTAAGQPRIRTGFPLVPGTNSGASARGAIYRGHSINVKLYVVECRCTMKMSSPWGDRLGFGPGTERFHGRRPSRSRRAPVGQRGSASATWRSRPSWCASRPTSSSRSGPSCPRRSRATTLARLMKMLPVHVRCGDRAKTVESTARIQASLCGRSARIAKPVPQMGSVPGARGRACACIPPQHDAGLRWFVTERVHGQLRAIAYTVEQKEAEKIVAALEATRQGA